MVVLIYIHTYIHTYIHRWNWFQQKYLKKVGFPYNYQLKLTEDTWHVYVNPGWITCGRWIRRLTGVLNQRCDHFVPESTPSKPPTTDEFSCHLDPNRSKRSHRPALRFELRHPSISCRSKDQRIMSQLWDVWKLWKRRCSQECICWDTSFVKLWSHHKGVLRMASWTRDQFA